MIEGFWYKDKNKIQLYFCIKCGEREMPPGDMCLGCGALVCSEHKDAIQREMCKACRRLLDL